MHNYLEPALGRTEFTCPHCNRNSSILWQTIQHFEIIDFDIEVESNHLAQCKSCHGLMLFKRQIEKIDDDDYIHYTSLMVYPKHVAIPATKDMPENIQKIYAEASFVFEDSPRASCALLRLALQELMICLKDHYDGHDDLSGKDINQDIGILVKNHKLPAKVQMALDSVRVVGNNAVHPGALDINDNKDIAKKLFDLLNLIVEEMITKPVEEVYAKLPQGARDAIAKRDS